MSHAEYAPKRLPVLTRLAMALRQIPAVEFALSKFKTLLGGRTNAEQASEPLPPPSDVAKDEGETGAVVTEPGESDTASAVVESEAPAAGPVQSEIIGFASDETVHFDAETITADPAPDTDIVAADDAATSPIESDARDAAPVAVESSVEAGEELPEADDVAFVAATPDDLPDAVDDMPAADVVVQDTGQDTGQDTVEREMVETPPIAPEAAEIEPEDSCAAGIDTVEAAAPGAIEIVAPTIAAFDERDEPEAEPVAAAVEATTPVTEPDAVSEREALIRRRWKETGIMMWRGVGQSTLCIQGSTALLPPKPGETMPQYDRLEFKLIDGLIVCEGFVIEPPAPLKNRPFAHAA